MPIDEPNDLERVDQEIRVNELKEEAAELSSGQLTIWESDDCPPEMAEAFWRRVVDYEKAPLTCDFDRLIEAGVNLPEPDALTDAALTAKLWEVIERLAEMHVFLSSTNHLSDRELYTELWSDSLRELNPAMPFEEYGNCHLDILGGCSEEDMYLYYKYYADEENRRDWQQRWPDDEMPPHEDPPYDRDRRLPKARH